MWEPSAPRGKSVSIIGLYTLVIFCSFCINVCFSACICYRPYLSRHGSETSRTSSDALSQCGRSRFTTCSVVVPPSPVVLLHSSPERRDKIGPDPSRILRNRRWFAIGGAPWVWEPSAPRGKSVGVKGFDILVIFCAFYINVYFSACTCYRPYLSRHGSETSRTSSNALSQCGR